MRDFLERLGFYRFKEIDFLEEYLEISEYVKLLVVNNIENDQVFREYFGI
jgi:hypothetical protein